jgi:DUF4097 and DUF4098 domain-containing protein YvlB
MLGEIIMFQRSDGSWKEGKIREIRNDFYIVEWYESDGRIGSKLVHKRKTRRKINRRFLFSTIILIVLTALSIEVILVSLVKHLMK